MEGHTGKEGKNSGCFVEKYKSTCQKDMEKGALAISGLVCYTSNNCTKKAQTLRKRSR